MGKSLYEKVFERHVVGGFRRAAAAPHGAHLIHEVTSPQAFSMLSEAGLTVLMPERTFATVDHIIRRPASCVPMATPSPRR